ncbi:diaminopropionate ammonia-lyase [Amycolatopsis jejuensis]|uniref:diaminopropionate ammonia-lyase n=1 Tax=Amycolatopsis jejuensis TaxID=330084 RepID=UPI0006914F00|nr:diaminopropionate ammonia-lyase [Amycolatopsis jejuensis]
MTQIRVVSRDGTIDDRLLARVEQLLPEAGYREAAETLTSWPGYAPTPLVSCPDLASAAGVGQLLVKDESARLGLKSFKSLGGAYAVRLAYRRWREEHGADRPITDFVVTCVTDGNHGLSVAWGARELGCRCVIAVPAAVTDRRAKEIADLGAEVRRVHGNYDEVTAANSAEAAREGWVVITDTSSTDVAGSTVRDVMQGYRVLAEELVTQCGDELPTHVFLQAGCGGMAGALTAHLLTRWPADRFPAVVIVEPEKAACLLESAAAGEPQIVGGTHETIMGGLAVGEISLLAWEILRDAARHFTAIDDSPVAPAMRLLATPAADRPAVVSGETGAAGVAALTALAADPAGRTALGLGEHSRVLAVNTEGDTDPELYAELVGTLR